MVSELASNIIEHGNGSSLIIDLDVADPEWWGMEVVGGPLRRQIMSCSRARIVETCQRRTNLPGEAWHRSAPDGQHRRRLTVGARSAFAAESDAEASYA